MANAKQHTARPRVAFTYAETAELFGRNRSWVYRMVQRGKLRAIIGYGAAMIPAAEIERLTGKDGAA